MFQSQGFKIFLAVAVGAFIGATLALQLHWFLAIGMIVGGFAGYIMYELSTVRKAISQATQWFISELHTKKPGPGVLAATKAWISNWRVFTWLVAFFLVLGVWGIAVAAASLAIGTGGHLAPRAFAKTAEIIGFIALAFGIIEGIVLSLATMKQSSEAGSEFRKWVVYISPPIVLLRWLPKSLAWFTPRAWKATTMVFRLIHSDIRLLCGVDAAIGTAIGYYAHSALIGAVLGGLLGVVNYELVSKRWLKLVPTSR